MQKSVQTNLINFMIPLKLQYIITLQGVPEKKTPNTRQTRKKRLAKHKRLIVKGF